MPTRRDELIKWLNDAYSMERSVEETLKKHAKDAEDYPEVQTRVRRHLEQTQTHAERVRSCIESLGGDVSSLKAGFSEMIGKIKGAGSGLARDEMVKNALDEYMTEHLEIASYLSLIEAAESEGADQVAAVCREILRDEQEMAEWLRDRIPEVTRTYLAEVEAS